MSIKQETIGTLLGAHTSTIGVHQLLELSSFLDLELDLVTLSIAYLDWKGNFRGLLEVSCERERNKTDSSCFVLITVYKDVNVP